MKAYRWSFQKVYTAEMEHFDHTHIVELHDNSQTSKEHLAGNETLVWEEMTDHGGERNVTNENMRRELQPERLSITKVDLALIMEMPNGEIGFTQNDA